MNKSKYNRLNPDKNAIDTNFMSDSIDNVKICVKFRGQTEESMLFSLFKNRLGPSIVSVSTYRNVITGYCKFFGNQFSKNVYIKF